MTVNSRPSLVLLVAVVVVADLTAAAKFEDNFDGDQLDANKWSFQTGNEDGGWGNQELETYTEQNVQIKNGNLVSGAILFGKIGASKLFFFFL